jgi:heme/copper-type cytochrome/quinol oxidase subunit 4
MTTAWLVLLVVTLLSFANAEFVAARHVAIVAICLIAVLKVTIILRRFMELSHAPKGIATYLTIWSGACGAIIGGLWLAG